MVNASDCGSDTRGFDSLRSPHIHFADVVELADTPHSKCGAERLAGSSPAIGIRQKRVIKLLHAIR